MAPRPQTNSSDDEWEEVPKPSSAAANPAARQSWMVHDAPSQVESEPSDIMSIIKTAGKGKSEREKQREERERMQQEIASERAIKDIKENKKFVFGDKGSNWRMMKLKRVFETAKEMQLDVQDVALERYGTLEDFNEALAERDFLDSKLKASPVVKPATSAYRAPMKKSDFKAPSKAVERMRDRGEPETTASAPTP
ncbi:hypothetical protein HDU91_002210, partial [Kappamyces sp. JEL0680]